MTVLVKTNKISLNFVLFSWKTVSSERSSFTSRIDCRAESVLLVCASEIFYDRECLRLVQQSSCSSVAHAFVGSETPERNVQIEALKNLKPNPDSSRVLDFNTDQVRNGSFRPVCLVANSVQVITYIMTLVLVREEG